ncbi:type IV secretion system DNA-binding domain-containing protein [Streptomyces sp. NPDC048341]|uniref:type IV secretory system conjugative DNA transfer family protein n=1 Tax=Streptomyces sp. NPDC048341 TaxID=3154620 RepID=UPI0034202078
MSVPELLSLSAVSAPLIGVGFVEFKDMQTSASGHLPFKLHFPADLDTDQVANWFRSLGGTLPRGGHLFGSTTVVLENLATEHGITHRLLAPKEHADFIVPQLRTLVPGINVTPDDQEEAEAGWTAAVELGQSNPSRSLSLPDLTAVAHSVLGTFQGLQRGEALKVQYVLSPAVRERPPVPTREHTSTNFSLVGHVLTGTKAADKDEIADRRARAAEPSFLGVIRIAARANSTKRARLLVSNVRKVFSSTGSPHNRIRNRYVSTKRVARRVDRASSPLLFPGRYSTTELVGLTGWPLGDPHVAGLPRGRTRQLPATGAIPRTGLVLAQSTFSQDERLIALDPVQAAQHTQIVGPTGSGKTALITNLIAQNMAAGRGVILIESKGDLYNSVLDSVPKHRAKDVVLVDVTDTDYPAAFNILQGSPYVVATDIQRLFDHLYPQDAKGIRVRQGFYHLILTLLMSKNATRPMTFADIGPLMVPRANQGEFSDQLIRGVSHVEELALWWQEISNLPRAQRDAYFKPISDRTWQLNNRRAIRNIIGQSDSTIDLRDIIQGRKILLVNLGRSTEGADTAGLLGSLLLNAIWGTVQRGAADPNNPTMLYLDEFQDFLNLPISPADWFAQARSFGLAVTVAHQYVGQLSRELQDATQNNARTKVVFQTSADEASYFARQFGRRVSPDDFMNLQRYEVIMRLATTDGVSSPVTGMTLPPVEPTGFAEQIRKASRAAYARPVAEVEADIRNRHSNAARSAPKAKRKFGGRAWNE